MVGDAARTEGGSYRNGKGKPLRFHMARKLNQNLSGNEVYHTAYSLQVILKKCVVNFIVTKVSIQFSFHVRFGHISLW